MRTWTVVAAGLVAASVGVTAAVVPTGAGQSAQGDVKPPAAEKTEDDQPRREVRRHIEVLGGQDVRIGVGIRDPEGDEARTSTGAVVTSVREDSPAEKAGMKEGDVIAEFDGEKVRSARQLSRLVAETVPGRPVQAVVQRDGRRVDLQVTPEAGMAWLGGPGIRRQFEFGGALGFKFDGPAIGDLLEKELGEHDGDVDTLIVRPGRGRLGIGIQTLTPQLAEYFGTKDGALVTTVEPDSAAAKAGLKAGDVITAVGETAVHSPSDLSRAVRRADAGTELSITYTRDKKSATTKAPIASRSREKARKGGQPI